MEQSTAYFIMIFLPIIPWLLKMIISYKIRYKTPKLNVDKFYKKNKSSFIKKYFYIDIRQRLQPLIYVANFLVGGLLIPCVILSLIYLILVIFKYELSCLIIPQFAMYFTISLTVILLFFGILEIVDDKIKK